MIDPEIQVSPVPPAQVSPQNQLQQVLQRLVLEAIFDRGLASTREIIDAVGEHRALLFVPDADQRIRAQIDHARSHGLIEDGGLEESPRWGLSEAGLQRLGEDG
jgi:hypothetical protein